MRLGRVLLCFLNITTCSCVLGQDYNNVGNTASSNIMMPHLYVNNPKADNNLLASLENTKRTDIDVTELKFEDNINVPKLNSKGFKKFSKEELALIENGDSMMHVYQVTDSAELKVLKNVSTDVDPSDQALVKLKDRMLLTVKDEAHRGVGIAAPQVGINRNLIWVQRFDKNGDPFEFYINPKIVWKSQLTRQGSEGCLSIPDRKETILRSYAIRLQYLREDGKQVEENIEGFTAVIFQHEVDHLFGILYPDRLTEQEGKESIPLNEKIQFSVPDDRVLP